MKKSIITLASLMVAFFIGSPAKAQQARPDERLELISSVFRLAGADEWSMVVLKDYSRQFDAYFEPYREHPAVLMVDSIRSKHGVAFDAVPGIALHVDLVDGRLVAKDILHPYVLWRCSDKEDTLSDIDRFLDEVSDFYRVSNFEKFYKDNLDFYRRVCADLDKVIEENIDMDWILGFSGDPNYRRPEVFVGFNCGYANYGLSGKDSSTEDVCAVILGSLLDGEETGIYYESSPMMLNLIVHEHAHPFCNPAVNAYSEALATSGEKIFPVMQKTMARQAYGNWFTVLYESMVRATVVQYFRENDPDGYRQHLDREMKRGFFFTEELADLLDEYSRNRDMYPSLKDFMPRIVAYLNDLAETDVQARFDAAVGS